MIPSVVKDVEQSLSCCWECRWYNHCGKTVWQYIYIFFFLNKFIYLFIYFWLLRAGFLSSCGEWGLLLIVVHGLLLLQSTGSRRPGFSSCGSRALELRLSSCGAQA